MKLTFRHLKGVPAALTIAAGTGICALGARLILESFDGAKGPEFLAATGALIILVGFSVISLPWRIVTTLSEDGIRVGWMFGRRFIPREEIRSVVLGPLGTGKERDPTALTILLKSGEEVLFSSMGKKRVTDHEEARRFMEAARQCGIKVHDVLAPVEEREERERAWRELRKKGHR